MKCLLYIPPFECEGIKLPNIAYVRIGGLTLYQRACRSIQKAAFDEIIIAKPKALEFPADDPSGRWITKRALASSRKTCAKL